MHFLYKHHVTTTTFQEEVREVWERSRRVAREEEEGRGEQESVGDKHRALASEQETSLKEDSVLTSLDENGKVVPQPSSPLVADRDDKGSPKHSLEFTDPLSDISHVHSSYYIMITF